jgi:GT2 family glycosyltransferase
MKVSVIMSCHDRLHSLRNTLTSWSRVDYPDFELTLIDNGSIERDGLRDIFRGLFGLFDIHIVHQPPMAVNRLWNEWGKVSDGEYVVFAMADEIVTPDVLTRMVAYGDQRCSVNTLFLDEAMTNAMNVLNWEKDPKVIEFLPGFWDYEYKGSNNRDKHSAELLSHVIGWTRKQWDWFGWFRDNDRGHLWLDQDVVIRSRVLGIKSETVDGISCYHQHHPTPVDPAWLAPGYHPINERQARLLEESERDAT